MSSNLTCWEKICFARSFCLPTVPSVSEVVWLVRLSWAQEHCQSAAMFFTLHITAPQLHSSTALQVSSFSQLGNRNPLFSSAAASPALPWSALLWLGWNQARQGRVANIPQITRKSVSFLNSSWLIFVQWPRSNERTDGRDNWWTSELRPQQINSLNSG